MISREIRLWVDQRIQRALEKYNELAVEALVRKLPRRTQVSVTNLAAGATTTVNATWAIPLSGPYGVATCPIVGQTPAGLIHASIVFESKTASGCQLIVANRSANLVAAAGFDVIAIPEL